MENRNTRQPEKPPARVRNQPIEDADAAEDEGREDDGDIRNVETEADLHLGGDTGFDRVIGPDEAGLGAGLDQAEEARLGVTDEELAEMARRRRTPKR